MAFIFMLIVFLLGIFSFILIVVGFIFIGLPLMFLSALIFAIGKEISEHIPLNKLDENIIGKDLKYIENIIGTHTSVDVSNNNARIYKWKDRLEIICDKNNVCKEVLKRD